MVAVARDTLPAHRVSLLVGALENPLPEGPFDLVYVPGWFIISTLTVKPTSSGGSPTRSNPVGASSSPTS